MTYDDEFEKELAELKIALDGVQERAPLTVSGMLAEVCSDVHDVLETYRENRAQEDGDSDD